MAYQKITQREKDLKADLAFITKSLSKGMLIPMHRVCALASHPNMAYSGVFGKVLYCRYLQLKEAHNEDLFWEWIDAWTHYVRDTPEIWNNALPELRYRISKEFFGTKDNFSQHIQRDMKSREVFKKYCLEREATKYDLPPEQSAIINTLYPLYRICSFWPDKFCPTHEEFVNLYAICTREFRGFASEVTYKADAYVQKRFPEDEWLKYLSPKNFCRRSESIDLSPSSVAFPDFIYKMQETQKEMQAEITKLSNERLGFDAHNLIRSNSVTTEDGKVLTSKPEFCGRPTYEKLWCAFQYFIAKENSEEEGSKILECFTPEIQSFLEYYIPYQIAKRGKSAFKAFIIQKGEFLQGKGFKPITEVQLQSTPSSSSHIKQINITQSAISAYQSFCVIKEVDPDAGTAFLETLSSQLRPSVEMLISQHDLEKQRENDANAREIVAAQTTYNSLLSIDSSAAKVYLDSLKKSISSEIRG